MKKRWGVRVIAILMLIAGLLLFLLGILSAIRMAARGTEMGLGAWLALPGVFGGCVGALFLVIAGSLLLTLVKIADNFAAATQPLPEKRTAPVVAEIAAPAQAVAEGPRPGAAVVATTVVAVPETEIVSAPAAVIAGAVVAGERLGAEAEIPPAGEIVQEVATPAGLEVATIEEEAEPVTEAAPAGMSAVVVAAEVLEPQAAEIPPPQDEISALQTQLAALQAQLAELEGAPPELEELPEVVEDEGPAPGASEELKLPGADEAARVAAEMAVLEPEPETEG
jgi:hypothetical protein